MTVLDAKESLVQPIRRENVYLAYCLESVSCAGMVEGTVDSVPANKTTAPAFGLLTRDRATFESKGAWVMETYIFGSESDCSSDGTFS